MCILLALLYISNSLHVGKRSELLSRLVALQTHTLTHTQIRTDGNQWPFSLAVPVFLFVLVTWIWNILLNLLTWFFFFYQMIDKANCQSAFFMQLFLHLYLYLYTLRNVQLDIWMHFCMLFPFQTCCFQMIKRFYIVLYVINANFNSYYIHCKKIFDMLFL